MNPNNPDLDVEKLKTELLKNAGYGQDRDGKTALLFVSPLIAICVLGFLAFGAWRYISLPKTLVFLSCIWICVGLIYQSSRTVACGSLSLAMSLLFASAL